MRNDILTRRSYPLSLSSFNRGIRFKNICIFDELRLAEGDFVQIHGKYVFKNFLFAETFKTEIKHAFQRMSNALQKGNASLLINLDVDFWKKIQSMFPITNFFFVSFIFSPFFSRSSLYRAVNKKCPGERHIVEPHNFFLIERACILVGKF